MVDDWRNIEYHGQMFRAHMAARPAKRQHDKLVKDLIAALNKARRATLH